MRRASFTGMEAWGLAKSRTPRVLAAVAAAALVAAGAAHGAPAPAPSASVRQLQVDLRALGYFKASPTGYSGPKTVAAVTAFQRAAGLTADGIAGPQTLAAIATRRGRPVPVTATVTAPAATTGPLTTAQLQTYLSMLSFYDGKVDGVLGPATIAAVKQLQAAAGLTPDGNVGPATEAAIAKLLRTRG